jgi:DNA-binding GntR family transcriptional regulator
MNDTSTPRRPVESAGPPPLPRRDGERTRTIPEQIADHLGIAILNGDYRSGERVLEQQIAEAYGVSRGPVREAIRTLANRGLVELIPRRGAYVVDISLDTIADVFNVRAVLLGLAARCYARQPSPRSLGDLFDRIWALQGLATDDGTDPVAFAHATGRAGAVIYRQCGNGQLTRMLRVQNEGSLWGLIWRERPLDFLTPDRRRQAAADWLAAATEIQAGRDLEAERIVRKALFESRDASLAMLRQLRHEAVHPSRLLKD